jgi:hypothetical protein
VRRRVPDKYLAIGLFLLLLGLHLWQPQNDMIAKMVFAMFSLVCMAVGDGLRFVSDSFKARRYDSTQRPDRKTESRTDSQR